MDMNFPLPLLSGAGNTHLAWGFSIQLSYLTLNARMGMTGLRELSSSHINLSMEEAGRGTSPSQII
jgi:hypothetical protein